MKNFEKISPRNRNKLGGIMKLTLFEIYAHILFVFYIIYAIIFDIVRLR